MLWAPDRVSLPGWHLQPIPPLSLTPGTGGARSPLPRTSSYHSTGSTGRVQPGSARADLHGFGEGWIRLSPLQDKAIGELPPHPTKPSCQNPL